MSDANFASLSSTLLARKGGAKPAMRPQSAALGPVDGASAAANLEDLGWNDMGEDAPQPDAQQAPPAQSAPTSISLAETALIKKPALPPLEEREALKSGDEDAQPRVVAFNPLQSNDDAAEVDAGQNQVRESLDRIASQLDSKAAITADNEDDAEEAAAPVVLPKAIKPAPARSKAAAKGKRAAFTLRLDPERHLMLRLACTVRGSSAQQLVTDALDGLLAEMPEIAMLAAQVQKKPN